MFLLQLLRMCDTKSSGSYQYHAKLPIEVPNEITDLWFFSAFSNCSTYFNINLVSNHSD